MKTQNILISIILFTLLIATRLIPHIANFTPVFAIGLFSYTLFKRNYLSFIIPLIGMFFTDLIIGFYQNVWAVYLSMVIAIVLSNLIKTNKKQLTTITRSLTAPTIFFVLSNLSVFFVWYPLNISGFIQCYVNAIPFYGYSIISTIVYSFVFSSLYSIIFENNLSLNN